MALKGDRKRVYMAPYMRRRRATHLRKSRAEIEQQLAAWGLKVAGPEPRPVVKSLDDPAVSREVDRHLYEEWRQTA